MRSIALAIAAVAIAAGLTACESPLDSGSELTSSGSQPPAVGGNQGAIQDTVTQLLTTKDPSSCSYRVTHHFLDVYYKSSSRKPVEKCKDDNSGPGQPDVNRGTASVTVAAAGGSLDGSILTMRLVRDGGAWKLYRFTKVQIDRARFDGAQKTSALQEGFTPREARCAVAPEVNTASTNMWATPGPSAGCS